MRYVRRKKFRCVQAQDAISFESEMNAILDIAGIPEVNYDRNQPFTAYILYSIEEKIPETISETYELAGLGKTCGDCPHLIRDGNKRKKQFPCPYSTYGETLTTTRACDRYYEDLEAGVFLAGETGDE